MYHHQQAASQQQQQQQQQHEDLVDDLRDLEEQDNQTNTQDDEDDDDQDHDQDLDLDLDLDTDELISPRPGLNRAGHELEQDEEAPFRSFATQAAAAMVAQQLLASAAAICGRDIAAIFNFAALAAQQQQGSPLAALVGAPQVAQPFGLGQLASQAQQQQQQPPQLPASIPPPLPLQQLHQHQHQHQQQQQHQQQHLQRPEQLMAAAMAAAAFLSPNHLLLPQDLSTAAGQQQSQGGIQDATTATATTTTMHSNNTGAGIGNNLSLALARSQLGAAAAAAGQSRLPASLLAASGLREPKQEPGAGKTMAHHQHHLAARYSPFNSHQQTHQHQHQAQSQQQQQQQQHNNNNNNNNSNHHNNHNNNHHHHHSNNHNHNNHNNHNNHGSQSGRHSNLLSGHHHHSSIQTQQQLLATKGFNPLAVVGAGQQTEILTPTHLKKAKLMFFYVRYPNSSTLKDSFQDVRFNKNNTAQLVKWFSNFREFYYIQMEKFARDAINDDRIQSKEDIVVGQDHELINQLNNHYNKNRHIALPDVFRGVVEETLRHFFDAIQQKRDQEQSWKKSIYKLIARLDEPVPEYFKSELFSQQLE